MGVRFMLKAILYKKEKKQKNKINKKDYNFLKIIKWNRQGNIYQGALLLIKE